MSSEDKEPRRLFDPLDDIEKEDRAQQLAERVTEEYLHSCFWGIHSGKRLIPPGIDKGFLTALDYLRTAGKSYLGLTTELCRQVVVLRDEAQQVLVVRTQGDEEE